MRPIIWMLASVSILATQAALAEEVIVLDTITIEGNGSTGGPKGPSIARDSSTASKTATPILETPRSISVITEQRMADQGVRTVQDALVYSSGVYGAAFGFDTRGDWSKVRGLTPEELRDGLKWNFGYYNNVRPHPYSLETVEVLKGPASVLYGSGSAGGIVNVTSKLPQEETRREAFIEYGSHNWKQLGVDMTGKLTEDGNFLYRLVGAWRDSDTQVDYVPDDNYFFSPSISWRPSIDTNLTLHLNLQRSKTGTSTQFLPWRGTLLPAPEGKIPTSRFLSEPGWDKYDTEQAAVTAILDHRFNEIWSIGARARYSDSSADYNSIYPTFPPTVQADGRINRIAYESDATARVFTGDVHLNAEFDTGPVDHKLAFGVDHQYAKTANVYSYAPAGLIDLYNPVYGNLPGKPTRTGLRGGTTRQTGLYIQDQLRFAGGWIAGLGLRYDLATDAKDHQDRVWSKDLGLMYQFDNGIAPYVSYSESFSPITGVNAYGDPFKPETGKQYEAGIKYQPTGSPSVYTASVFQINKENLQVSDPTNPQNQIQAGEVKIYGVELEMQTRWNDFELLANYTYLDTKDATGYRLETVPDHLASAWLTYRPETQWQGFKAGAGLRYVGKTWDGKDNLHTKPYVLADAMIGFEQDHWSITLSGRNLFDKVHLTTCLARGDCFYGDRRSFALNLTTKF